MIIQPVARALNNLPIDETVVPTENFKTSLANLVFCYEVRASGLVTQSIPNAWPSDVMSGAPAYNLILRIPSDQGVRGKPNVGSCIFHDKDLRLQNPMAQKAMSREAPLIVVPTLDLNHWRF